MPSIELDQQSYDAACRHALNGGYANVDAYVAAILLEQLDDPSPDLNHLFTTERIAELDHISAGIDAGEPTYTIDEVRDYFDRKRVK